jgi:hypothetical protein
MIRTRGQIESEISDKAGDVATFKQMEESPAWQLVYNQLEQQIRDRSLVIVMSPLEDGTAVYRQEFMKGEVAGLGLAKNLPRLAREAAELELSRLHEELKETPNDSQEKNPAGTSRVDGDSFG